MIYKIDVKAVNKFFVWASGFSYELYLVHSLVFAVMAFCLNDVLSIYALIAINLLTTYAAGYGYSIALRKMRLK